MSDLARQSCVPCRGGVPPLAGGAIIELLRQLPGWEAVHDHHLRKIYAFPDFVSALAFVNRAGEIAEREGHHPDLGLSWGKVEVTVYTHKIDGLTESDFILAAKLEEAWKNSAK